MRRRKVPTIIALYEIVLKVSNLTYINNIIYLNFFRSANRGRRREDEDGKGRNKNWHMERPNTDESRKTGVTMKNREETTDVIYLDWQK